MKSVIEDLGPIRTLLTRMIKAGGNELIIAVGAPPLIRTHRGVEPLEGEDMLTVEDAEAIIFNILSKEACHELEVLRRTRMEFNIEGLGRFQGHALKDRGALVGIFRLIPVEPLTMDELMLPRAVMELFFGDAGLGIVCGPRRHVRQMILATLVDTINRTRKAHIVTFENPVERLHTHKMSVVYQCCKGEDAHSLLSVKNIVDQYDTEVVVVDELDDPETAAVALDMADTRLVLTTVPAAKVVRAVYRVIEMFPPERQAQIRTQLSYAIQGVVGVTNVPRSDNFGNVFSFELLLAQRNVREAIRRGAIDDLSAIMENSLEDGMLSTNICLSRLVCRNVISQETAYRYTPTPRALERMIEEQTKKLEQNEPARPYGGLMSRKK